MLAWPTPSVAGFTPLFCGFISLINAASYHEEARAQLFSESLEIMFE
jgi:hypothetical protein